MTNELASRFMLVACGLCALGSVEAAQSDIHGPSGSVFFGTSVVVLPNGNFVVTDPGGPVSAIGVVYLYAPDGSVIGTLYGATAGDHVGNSGIRVVGDNFVVLSQSWHNGPVANAGAATWVNGSTGFVSGSSSATNVVSASNSLVGSHANDAEPGFIVPLANGNYLVGNGLWNAGVGAVTWCKNDGSTVGVVSSGNSLTGSVAGDYVGYDVTVLSDGNYVVVNPYWSNPSPAMANVGATTWLSGSGPFAGVVSSANSFIGSKIGDYVGNGGVTALPNGHYVVSSANWINDSNVQVGAATWRSGGSAAPDTPTAGNSLFGTTASDQVGTGGAIALSNGDYVVRSYFWNGGSGAVTWGNGATGTIGPVSAVNSLIGTSTGDHVGDSVTALANGNYVVTAPGWHNASVQVGAAILIDGSGPYSGSISTANALFGTSMGDQVGRDGLAALSDGNYLVRSGTWNGGVGAVTWGNGSSGTDEPVTASDSLIGSASGDHVGNAGQPIVLANGNYVVLDNQWSNGTGTGNFGAITWCRAGGACTGTISPARSLHGTAQNDALGDRGTAFGDGNYAVASPTWNGYGAVTLANGAFRLKGTVASWNSVIGGVANLGSSMTYDYDPARKRLLVGRPGENIVSLFTMDQIFADDLDP